MGSYAVIPEDETAPGEKNDTGRVGLGELLSGRLSDVRIDSVEAVREARERE